MSPEVRHSLLNSLIPDWDQLLEIRGERKALCPLHEDRNPSLRIRTADLAWYCDPCGIGGGVWDLAIRMLGEAGARELLEVISPASFDSGETVRPHTENAETTGTSRPHPRMRPDATVRSVPDLTLASYAEAKKLPIEFLTKLGIQERSYMRGTALYIPYLDESGQEIAVRWRQHLEKEEADGRFRWKTGSKPTLYGLRRLAIVQANGSVVLCEGESDTQTCWPNRQDDVRRLFGNRPQRHAGWYRGIG